MGICAVTLRLVSLGPVYVAVQHGLNYRVIPWQCKWYLLHCNNLEMIF